MYKKPQSYPSKPIKALWSIRSNESNAKVVKTGFTRYIGIYIVRFSKKSSKDHPQVAPVFTVSIMHHTGWLNVLIRPFRIFCCLSCCDLIKLPRQARFEPTEPILLRGFIAAGYGFHPCWKIHSTSKDELWFVQLLDVQHHYKRRASRWGP